MVRSVTRTITILGELDKWINDFRAKMLEHQRQSVSYTAALNMIGRFGATILSQPNKLTNEQKTTILEFIEEANRYKPPYAQIKWADEYLKHMVPKILDGTVKEPWEKETKTIITNDHRMDTNKANN